MRIQFEIKESLANILDQLTHSDFWATEIKEDESGKKIIKPQIRNRPHKMTQRSKR